MARAWQGHGRGMAGAMAGAWQGHGRGMAGAMAGAWQGHGKGMARAWQGHDAGMARAGHGRGMTQAWQPHLLPCNGMSTSVRACQHITDPTGHVTALTRVQLDCKLCMCHARVHVPAIDATRMDPSQCAFNTTSPAKLVSWWVCPLPHRQDARQVSCCCCSCQAPVWRALVLCPHQPLLHAQLGPWLNQPWLPHRWCWESPSPAGPVFPLPDAL